MGAKKTCQRWYEVVVYYRASKQAKVVRACSQKYKSYERFFIPEAERIRDRFLRKNPKFVYVGDTISGPH